MSECGTSSDLALGYSTAKIGVRPYWGGTEEKRWLGWAINDASADVLLPVSKTRSRKRVRKVFKLLVARAAAPPEFLSIALRYALRQYSAKAGVASPLIKKNHWVDRNRSKNDFASGKKSKVLSENLRDQGVSEADKDKETHVVCKEIVRGRRRTYRALTGAQSSSFETEEERESQAQKVRAFFAGYLLPQGYPESVAPQYTDYMRWRGVQYLFGGAISVFTTRCLLSSLGIAGKRSGESAAAINWVLKDGAGRLGKFLFARWGRALDCELKQFRLLGDLLMESGAALELWTISMPGFFLPLACSANLLKNLAAVAASSTRAPIYRTFALQNNMADVTAKGESVANLSDVVGTAFGILLSRAQLPLYPTFCALSLGYLIASRKEVDAVELPYFNRVRLAQATRRFFQTGIVPGVPETNHSELLLPWGMDAGRKVVLGASIGEAFETPQDFQIASDIFSDKPYLLSHRPSSKKVYVVLREKLKPVDILEAAFHAHLFLHLCPLHEQDPKLPLKAHVSTTKARSEKSGKTPLQAQYKQENRILDSSGFLEGSKALSNVVFQEFVTQSTPLGWKLNMTVLNPKENRLLAS